MAMNDRTDRLKTRWMVRSDVDQIMEVFDNQSFTRKELLDALRSRTNIGIAMAIDGVVSAYCIYEIGDDVMNVRYLLFGSDEAFHHIVELLKNKFIRHRRIIYFFVPEDDMDTCRMLSSHGIIAKCIDGDGLIHFIWRAEWQEAERDDAVHAG